MITKLGKTCRCCLNPAENEILNMSEHLLFDGQVQSDRNLKIIDIYHELCVDPAQTNQGALNICSSCQETLQKFVSFRVQCRQNNEKYQNLWLQAESTGQESFIYNERRVSKQQLVSEVLILKLKAEVKSEPESDNDHEETAALKECSESDTDDERQPDQKSPKIKIDEQLVCLGCKQTFSNKKSLRHHITKAVHNGFKSQNGVIKNSYNCLACGMEFEMVADMDVHLRETHPDEKHFPCFYCKKSFTTHQLYQRSFARLCTNLKVNYISRQGSDVPTIDCDRCSEKFYEEEQMLCHRISEHVEGVEKKKVNRCEICKLDFKAKKSFYRHMKEKHTKEYQELKELKLGRYVCTNCGKGFSRSKSLRIHIERVHLNIPKDVKCLRCPSTFKLEKDLKKHLKQHENLRIFECNECGHRFFQLKTLHAHLLFKHFRSSCRFQCTICEKRFLSNCKLKRHMGLHNTSKNYHCQLCDVKCKTDKGLLKHIEVQHTSRQFTENKLSCKICNILFRLKKSLYEHMRQQHPVELKLMGDMNPQTFVCSACGKIFGQARTLKVHFATMHCDNPKDLQCARCSMLFKCKRALQKHSRLHDKLKNWECNECGQHFRELKTLRSHLFLKHFRSCCRFSCNICDKRFVSNCDLKRHTRLHTGIKNHKCEFCDVKYATDEGLKRHIQVKHTQLRYDCKICDAKLKLKSDMWEHAFKHRDYFPYNCSDCDKGFIDKNRIRRHLKTAHNLQYNDSIHGYHKETFDQVVASCVKIDESNAVHFRGKRAVTLISSLSYLKQLAKENSQQSEESETMEQFC